MLQVRDGRVSTKQSPHTIFAGFFLIGHLHWREEVARPGISSIAGSEEPVSQYRRSQAA